MKQQNSQFQSSSPSRMPLYIWPQTHNPDNSSNGWQQKILWFGRYYRNSTKVDKPFVYSWFQKNAHDRFPKTLIMKKVFIHSILMNFLEKKLLMTKRFISTKIGLYWVSYRLLFIWSTNPLNSMRKVGSMLLIFPRWKAAISIFMLIISVFPKATYLLP